jgi:hypothetical protein
MRGHPASRNFDGAVWLKASLPWTMDRLRAQNIVLPEFSSTRARKTPFGQGGKA